jgi:hypothetical protein
MVFVSFHKVSFLSPKHYLPLGDTCPREVLLFHRIEMSIMYIIFSKIAIYCGHSPYSSPNIVRVIKSKRMRWVSHVARMEEVRGVFYKVLVGRPEGKKPLGRPRSRWEDNIKLDLREIWLDEATWIQLAEDRVQRRAFVNTVMNLRVP